MRRDKAGALILAGVLVAWPNALARLPQHWRPWAAATFSTGLALVADVQLGLRPPRLWAGLRAGALVAAVIAAVTGASPMVSSVRQSMRERELTLSPAQWLGVHIPIGTAWSEELAFRGVLQPVATEAFGPRAGRLLQAVAFGLAHIHPARVAGDSVPGTVVVTGVAGWLLGRLRERTGSVTAPLLAHLALNESGAAATLIVQGRRNSGETAVSIVRP